MRFSPRQATIEDLPRLGECGQAFFSASGLPGTFHFEHFQETWRGILNADLGVIFILEKDKKIVGALGALTYPDSNTADKVAIEAYWFVLKEYRSSLGGGRLYRAFENWARERGCAYIRMAYLTASMPEEVARMYEREGFTPIEVHYSKALVVS